MATAPVSGRTESGTIAPMGSVPATVTVVEEVIPEGATVYTVFTPNPRFSGVVHHREFLRGRFQTANVELARLFQSDYGYKVEPDLPEPPARPAKRKRS